METGFNGRTRAFIWPITISLIGGFILGSILGHYYWGVMARLLDHIIFQIIFGIIVLVGVVIVALVAHNFKKDFHE